MVLGEKWLDAVPLIELLAIAGVVTAIASPITSCLIALGKPNVVAMLSLLNASVLLPSVVYFAQRDGALGAAYAVLLTSGVALPVFFGVAMRYLHLRLLDVGAIFLRPVLASALMYFVVRRVLHVTGYDAVDLAVSVFVGAVVFVVVLLTLWAVSPRSPTSGEAFILERVRERLPQAARGA